MSSPPPAQQAIPDAASPIHEPSPGPPADSMLSPPPDQQESSDTASTGREQSHDQPAGNTSSAIPTQQASPDAPLPAQQPSPSPTAAITVAEPRVLRKRKHAPVYSTQTDEQPAVKKAKTQSGIAAVLEANETDEPKLRDYLSSMDFRGDFMVYYEATHPADFGKPKPGIAFDKKSIKQVDNREHFVQANGDAAKFTKSSKHILTLEKQICAGWTNGHEGRYPNKQGWVNDDHLIHLAIRMTVHAMSRGNNTLWTDKTPKTKRASNSREMVIRQAHWPMLRYILEKLAPSKFVGADYLGNIGIPWSSKPKEGTDNRPLDKRPETFLIGSE